MLNHFSRNTDCWFQFRPEGLGILRWPNSPNQSKPVALLLLGTTYGGDGHTSFALPDIRSRTPIHRSDSHLLGQKSGRETVTLTAADTVPHPYSEGKYHTCN